jgi:hypothetical protein
MEAAAGARSAGASRQDEVRMSSGRQTGARSSCALAAGNAGQRNTVVKKRYAAPVTECDGVLSGAEGAPCTERAFSITNRVSALPQ